MKIYMFIAHMGIGGAERVAVTLANEWADLGHEVNIVVLNLDNDIYTDKLRAGIQVHELGVSRLRYSFLPMYRFIRRHKPGFIFVFGNEMAVILSHLRSLHLIDTPIIVRVLNNVNISLVKEDGVSKTVEKYLNSSQKKLSKMEFIIAQCDAMAKQLLKRNLAKESALRVVYNPVNPDLVAKVRELRLSPGEDRAGISVDGDGNNEKPLNTDTKAVSVGNGGCTEKPVSTDAKGCEAGRGDCDCREITFIGRIDPQKNPADLIEAFEKLLCKVREQAIGQRIVLRMVGSGNLDEKIKSMVQEKGLTDNVIFDGIRQDMEQVYASSDVVVLSSDYEGMPNCLIEAIASGIPVVSYDCPFGPREIITGDNGYLVPMGDTDALAEAMYTALNKDWDVDAIMASASKFSPKLAAAELVDVFEMFDKEA